MGQAGFVRVGGILRWIDTRDEAELLADIAKLEEQLRIERARVSYAGNRVALGQDGGPDLESVQIDAAEVGRKLDAARHSLKLLGYKREDERRRQVILEQQAEIERELPGIAPPPTATPEAFIAQAGRHALSRLLGSPDPHSPEGQAAALANLNSRDPAITEIPSAQDVLMGRAAARPIVSESPQSAPAPAKREALHDSGIEQRRDVLSGLRRRLPGQG